MPQKRPSKPSIEIEGRVLETQAELEQYIRALDERNRILKSEQTTEQKMSTIKALYEQIK